MSAPVLQTRAFAPSEAGPAAIERGSAAPLGRDEAKSPGTPPSQAYPLVSPRSGRSFPAGQPHTAAQRADTAWTSLSKACSSHFGTDEQLISGAGGAPERPPRWRPIGRCRGTRTYIFITNNTRLASALPLNGACVAASWWVQLEFHTQLGSHSDEE